MNKDLQQILFIDIETVPQLPQYDLLEGSWKKLWDKKAQFLIKNEQLPADVYERAGIYAEFGKIICISVGLIDKEQHIKIKSFQGHDEQKLLNEFAEMLNKFEKKFTKFAAHNGKEFDYPYIARRMLVNKIALPKILNLTGKKPWEVPHYDTLEMWKFGDYKHYTSLELLATIFGIPTPKDDISGADVAKVYYIDQDLERIVKYCEKDVLTLIKLYLCLNSIDLDQFVY